ncbi:MAG TPA: tetratricopeptide repeat protein [Pyrinomonadaceae bacterium]|jgi:Tfp pilus assembly protein PilF|nr:tetratricopeptide repeat protein [Pyrinomonadaceae bacterium]
MKHQTLQSAIVSLGLALIIACLAHQSVKATDTWTRVNSKHFTLIGNASEKDIRQVATRLEQFRDVFTRLLSRAKFDSAVPTTVIVFKSMSSYKPFNPKGYAGYFQKGTDVNYITLAADERESAFAVIYHEYVHIMLDNTTGNLPAWFNEGLAEYYSTFLIEDDIKVHVGELIPDHLQTLRGAKLYPLRALFAINHDSPEFDEGKKRGMFYAESWALVHYLMLGSNGQRVDQLGKYLDLIAANTSIEEAFKLAFQTEMESLEKELRRYVESETFHVQFATFRKKLEFDKEFKSSPVSEAEAEGYLGDLLVHTHNLAAAEARLQHAVALDAQVSMAQASLGMLRIRQGRFSEAKTMLGQAVADRSSNYLTHYYYAYALCQEGVGGLGDVTSYPPETVKIVRAELKRAIELNPDYTESHYLLAFVNMVAGDQLDDAAESLRTAIKLSPGRQDLVMQLGQLYFRQDKFDQAIQTLQPLRNSQDSSLQKQADILIRSIELLQKKAADGNASRASEGQVQPAVTPRGTTASAENNDKSKTPRSESDDLLEMLRSLKAGEHRLQGTFLRLDCDNRGIAYFIVQASNGVHKIRATVLDRVLFRTFVASPQEMTCGIRKNPENVVLTYRPSTDSKDALSKIDGEAVAVELMPADFRLKQ